MREPMHKAGDRVIDFRGELKGTVARVLTPKSEGKSYKITVYLDGEPEGVETIPYYENVFEPLEE